MKTYAAAYLNIQGHAFGHRMKIKGRHTAGNRNSIGLKLSHLGNLVYFDADMTDSTHSPSPHPSLEWPTERAFLHAVSTPLSTLGLELDHLQHVIKNSKDINEAQASVEQMRKVLDRVYQLIQTRRAQLPPKHN
jgi:hypothetical protein